MLPTSLMEAEGVVEAEEVTEAKEVAEAEETEEVVAPLTSGWTQVYPSRPVVPVGLVPHTLGDEQHHCHSHSRCSQRRAHL